MSATPIKNTRKKVSRLPVPPPQPVAGKKTNLRLDATAKDCLSRLKSNHGMSFQFAISRGVLMLEQSLLSQGRGL